jgi:hypothetical protein
MQTITWWVWAEGCEPQEYNPSLWDSSLSAREDYASTHGLTVGQTCISNVKPSEKIKVRHVTWDRAHRVYQAWDGSRMVVSETLENWDIEIPSEAET